MIIIWKIIQTIGVIIIGYGLGILGPLLTLQNRNTSPLSRLWCYLFIVWSIIVIIGVIYSTWAFE